MARKLEELGHFPKLISPQLVRPFFKSNKNDFVDAGSIFEAASRPSMRFVQTGVTIDPFSKQTLCRTVLRYQPDTRRDEADDPQVD